MEIEYRRGDLWSAEEDAIIHGCNAQGVMGSGVAALVRRRRPDAYEAYVERHRTHGLKLGEIIIAPPTASDPRAIINAVTQEFYGRDPNRVYVSYEAVEAAMAAINDAVVEQQLGNRIALPLIGAGLANGKWGTISKIIEEEARTFRPVVYLLDGKIPE